LLAAHVICIANATLPQPPGSDIPDRDLRGTVPEAYNIMGGSEIFLGPVPL
jgi:hypothetical protein